MSFSQIFDVFSRRDKSPAKASKPLTPAFKNRVKKLCRETLQVSDFWDEIHRRLEYLHGMEIRAILPVRIGVGRELDVVEFLDNCNDEHFLDFIEMIFRFERLIETLRTAQNVKGLVGIINGFLELDELPYFLTQFVVSPSAPLPPSVLLNPSSYEHRIEAYPQIIRRENEVLHETAIEPTLTLLINPDFASANDEFLEALKDYRKGDYRDCVAKCGSSLESVMKVICDQKRWSHPRNADASVLLKTILSHTNLAPFFKSHIQIIPIIRNELSSAHGAGTQQRVISRHVANFVINSTASTILLLVEETNP